MIVSLVFIVYFLVILSFSLGVIYSIKKNNTRYNSDCRNSFSILIPFRNEKDKLPNLIESLKNLNYPIEKFEIILIDDNSTDNWQELDIFNIKNLRILTNTNFNTNLSPKKQALTKGINDAKFEWIITVDADCIVDKNWLKSFDFVIEKESPYLIAGPVTFNKNESIIGLLQIIENFSLQGATIGSFVIKTPFMCNGANLCYDKQEFLKLNTFNGNLNIASGDDVFTLEKFKKSHPKKVTYNHFNGSTVKTYTEHSLEKIKNQRIRWASKSNHYSLTGKLIGLIVLSTNILFCFELLRPNLNLYYIVIKITVDFTLILLTAIFFRNIKPLMIYPVLSLIYPFYSSYIALLSLFKKFEWKSRSFSK